MKFANRIACPSCSSPLKSERGIRIGKKIACPKCKIAFTVRPEDAEQADGKDWYAWGCKSLLPRQKNDGSWTDGAYYGDNPILNTCFALLFLKRANLVADLTDKLQFLARLVTGVAQPPAKKE